MKNTKRGIGLIVTIVVIVVIAAIIGTVLLVVNNNNNNNDDISNNIQTNNETNNESGSINLTETAIEEEYNKKIDDNYLKILKFEVLDIIKVDDSHSGYTSFQKDVTRIIFYIKNGLRLSHTNGYNGYWDYDLKIITKDNIENEGSKIYPVAGTLDAILITYFRGDLELTNDDFKNMKIRDLYNLDIKFSNNLMQINPSQDFEANKITELSQNHYVFLIGKNEYGSSDDTNGTGCNAYKFYAMIEWGTDYTSIIDSNFEVIDSQTLEAITTSDVRIRKYLLNTSSQVDFIYAEADKFLEDKGLTKNENHKNTYIKEILISTYVSDNDSNNQTCYDAGIKLNKYGVKYTENGKNYYFK